MAKSEVAQLMSQGPVLPKPVWSCAQRDYLTALADGQAVRGLELLDSYDVNAKPRFKATDEIGDKPVAERVAPRTGLGWEAGSAWRREAVPNLAVSERDALDYRFVVVACGITPRPLRIVVSRCDDDLTGIGFPGDQVVQVCAKIVRDLGKFDRRVSCQPHR